MGGRNVAVTLLFTLFFGLCAAGRSFAEGIVAYYGFDESSWTESGVDSRTLDDSVYANDGFPRGGADTVSGGVVGRCGSFDGISGRVQIMSAGQLKYTGGSMTIAFYVKIDAGETDGGFLLSKPWGGGQYNYYIYLNADHSLRIHLDGASGWDSASTPVLSAGTWHLVVITLDADRSVKIYFDGNTTPALSTTHNITTGWTPPGGEVEYASLLMVNSLITTPFSWSGESSWCCKCLMDELVIWNRCLSAAETASLCDVSLVGVAGGRRGRTEYVRGEIPTVRVRTTSAAVTGIRLDFMQGGSVLATQTKAPSNRAAEFDLDTSPYAFGAYQLKATALEDNTEKATTLATIGVRYVAPESFIWGAWVGDIGEAGFDELAAIGLEVQIHPVIDNPGYTIYHSATDEINTAIRHNLGFTSKLGPDFRRGAEWDSADPADRQYFRINPDGTVCTAPRFSLSNSTARANVALSLHNQVSTLAGIPAFRPYLVINDDFASANCYGWDYSDAVKADFNSRFGQYPPTSMPSRSVPADSIVPASDIWWTWFDYCQREVNAGFNLVERLAVTGVRSDIKIGPIPGPMQQPLNWINNQYGSGPQIYPSYDFGAGGFNLVSSYCYNDFWLPNVCYTFWMETGHMGNRQMPEFAMSDCIDWGEADPRPCCTTAGYVRNSLYHILAGGAKGLNYFTWNPPPPYTKSPWAIGELQRQGPIIRRIGQVQKALAPAKRDIALLDSFTTYCYTPGYDVKDRFFTYANLVQAHFSVDLVAETEILQPGFLDNYAGVLICRVRYLPQAVYDALTSYINDDGLVVMDWSVPFSLTGAVRVETDIAEGLSRTAYSPWNTWPDHPTYGLADRIQAVKTALSAYFPHQYDAAQADTVTAAFFEIDDVPYVWFVNTHNQDEYAYNRPFYAPAIPGWGGSGGSVEDLVAWETQQMATPYTATVTMDSSWSTNLVPYDLVTGQQLTYANRQLNLSMERFGGSLVAFYPEAVGTLTLTTNGHAPAGQPFIATATVHGATTGNPMPGMVPVEFTLTDPSSNVSPVSQVIGTVNGVATLTWTPAVNDPAGGGWTITAKELASNQSVFQPIILGTNAPPSVSITSPANGASFAVTAGSGATINITASATDDSAVTKVEFYNNGILIGTDTSSSGGWTYSWTNVAASGAGGIKLTAKAYDNDNSSTTSAVVSCTVTDIALKCYWKFDEAGGSTAYDTSGTGNNGTLYNSPTRITGEKIINSLSFNGTSQYVQKASASGLPNVDATQTECFWYYVSSNPAATKTALAVTYGTGSTGKGTGTGFINSSGMKFGVWRNSNKSLIVSTSTLPSAGAWHHIAYVKSGSTKYLYIDGNSVSSTNATDTSSTATYITAARTNYSSGANFWPGKLDEIRIYKRALSSTEIQALAQGKQ